jgi:hypothetical protein
MSDRLPARRLLLESVAVILSILIAFAIDAWWDRTQAAGLEQELLATLESGFEENRTLALQVIEEARSQQERLGRFVAMSVEEVGRIPADSTYFVLLALWRPNYVNNAAGALVGGRLNSEAILATMEAGRLSLLSDTRLLTALADWQGLATDLAQRSDEVIAREVEVLSALARHSELQGLFAGAPDEYRTAGADRPEIPSAVAQRVRGDNELMSRVARKGFYSRIQVDFLEDIEAQADSVLVLVRANRRR